jgi:hypothetical protein
VSGTTEAILALELISGGTGIFYFSIWYGLWSAALGRRYDFLLVRRVTHKYLNNLFYQGSNPHLALLFTKIIDKFVK